MWKIQDHLTNKNGVLHIGGVNTIKLASKYDTPLFVTDEKRIQKNYNSLYNAFSKYCDKFQINYAVKANNNLAILRILRKLNSGADCSCPEEIFLAKKAGFSSSSIIYTGNYNSKPELEFALKSKVNINIDNLSLLHNLFDIGKPNFISFRVNPGVGKGGYRGLTLGGSKSKFGVSIRDAKKGFKLSKENNVKRFGLHMMTGSAILDNSYFKTITNKILDIAEDISETVGIKFDFINIGGGLGIPYNPNQKPLNINKIGMEIGKLFSNRLNNSNIGKPSLMMEPGRYVVGDSTILLSRVHSIKKTTKTFVGIDAGMNTLLRPALYDAYHQIYVANNLNSRTMETVNVCGQVCENTDIIAKNRKLVKIREGDTLAILNAGAYGFSMSSQYNSRPRAAEVLVSGGKSDLIREREKVTDLFKLVKIPKRLRK